MTQALLGKLKTLVLELEQIDARLNPRSLAECKRDLGTIQDGLYATRLSLEEGVDQSARGQIETHLRAVDAKVQTLNDRVAKLERNPLPLDVPARIQPAAVAQRQNAPQYFFASCNQYDPRFHALHTSREASNSACTPIAGQFVLSALEGKGESELDAVMQRGHAMMARLLREKPPAEGVHYAFDQIAYEAELSRLEPIAKDDFFMFLIHKNQGGARDYKRVLDLLKQQGGGAVLTTGGSSFGIVVKDDSTCLYFDPHGQRQLSGRFEAFAARLPSMEDAAKFLTERFFVDADAITGDERADYVEVSPVKLVVVPKKPLHLDPVKAPAVEFPQAGPTFQNMAPLTGISTPGLSSDPSGKDFWNDHWRSFQISCRQTCKTCKLSP